MKSPLQHLSRQKKSKIVFRYSEQALATLLTKCCVYQETKPEVTDCQHTEGLQTSLHASKSE